MWVEPTSRGLVRPEPKAEVGKPKAEIGMTGRQSGLIQRAAASAEGRSVRPAGLSSLILWDASSRGPAPVGLSRSHRPPRYRYSVAGDRDVRRVSAARRPSTARL